MRLLPTLPIAIAVAAAVASPGLAASDPPVGVPGSAIANTLRCQPRVAPRHGEPVLLVGGPWTARELWTWGWQRTLLRAGHPSCTLDLPQDAADDMQVSARHVVLAIRAVRARAHRSIAVYAVGWGGLIARLALTGWPDERRLVSDMVSVSGLLHGSETSGAVSCETSCPPAMWQRLAGSRLVAALGAFPDETPGPTAWTTVRTADDFVATPQDGPRPTSALAGATNLLVQDVCPNRDRDHLALAYDSVSYAALLDALRHRGPAQAARFRRPCARQYAPGLTQAKVIDRVSRAANAIVQRLVGEPRVTAEPPLLPPFAP